ncbi:hypothetical protein SEA_LEWANDO_53 [Arthrobacter phage Lewando]|nr:hypothetical protein SEA_LEWANDO_53 [Arthrobacter phage Lewando]
MTEKERLEKLLEYAIRLEFWDDVAHWRSELKKLEGEN